MSELVFLEPNKLDAVPFTTSKVIAEAAGMNHRRVKDAIRKHQEDFESFGLLGAYETESSGGRPEEIIKLNEEQAAFLMTLLKNTPVVVVFKKELVRQFYAMRAELFQRKIQRAELKPVRRELTDVIQEVDDGKWAYKQYTDLAYKSAIGKTAVRLRKERNAPKKAKAVDYMTANEITAVSKRQSQIAVLLEMGLDYQAIKRIVADSAQKDTLPSADDT